MFTCKSALPEFTASLVPLLAFLINSPVHSNILDAEKLEQVNQRIA